MPRASRDDSPHREFLDEFLVGAQRAAALKAALELEVFTRIAAGHRSLPAFLRATGFNERGARLLLDALSNIGLLNKSPFEYTLTPTAEAFLVKGSPSYYGDALLAALAWESRGQLARAARSGRPLASLSGDGGARWFEAQNAAWVDAPSILQQTAALWAQIDTAPALDTSLRCLAFGFQAALAMFTLVQRNSSVRLTTVDSAPNLQRLRTIAGGFDSNPNLEWIEGDWLGTILPRDSFDLAMVDSITESRSLEQNIGILHRAFEALVMGGRIVLRAAIADDDRRGPDLVPLGGLDILMGSADGDVYTSTEYRGMLEAAGFFEVKPVAGTTGILTARRTPPPPPPPPAATVAPDFIPPPEILE